MLLTVRKNSDFYAKIDLTDLDDNKIILDDGDELVFSVKKSLVSNSPVVIRKSFHDYDRLDGSYPFKLTADETNIQAGIYFYVTADETNIQAGIYFYDIALKCSDGDFFHITMPDQFVIRETVARKD